MSGFYDQRARFMRPDAHRYIRHDAYRFMKPGSPVYVGGDVVKYFWPNQRAQEPSKHDHQKFEQELEIERAALLRLKVELAALRAEIKFQRWLRGLKAYNPNQPRVPAGTSDGGQWTSEEGSGVGRTRVVGRNDPRVLSDVTPDNLIKPGARLAQNDQSSGRPIDLHEERWLGGHTIERHVGRSQQSLLNEVRDLAQRTERRGDFVDGLRLGSFPSLEAANKLVNSTLADNPIAIERVVTGGVPSATLRKEFGSVTGYEAYARTERSQPYIRNTTGVAVFILPDQRATKGYRVHSAYPRNFDR